MKKIYKSPDFEYRKISMIDAIMASTESEIPEIIEPGEGGGDTPGTFEDF